MTYQEIKDRLSKCELTLEKIKNGTHTSTDVKQKTEKLEILRESYIKLLKEAEKGIVFTDDEKKAKELADDGTNVKLTKEQEGPKFSIDETKAIAKKVGKAVALGLRSLGDQVKSMKATNIEEGSFEIEINYKGEGPGDEFSFYIVEDTLHLTDFSFDKELVDVGVKPSGEAVINVDVLANELAKHWKSQGQMEGKYKSDAQRKAIYATKAEKGELDEAPSNMYYIKVKKTDKASLNGLQDVIETWYSPVKFADIVDDDGAGNVIFYLKKSDWDPGMEDDIMGNGVQIVDTNMPLSETSDYARRRAAERDYQPSKKDKPTKKFKEPKNDYFARRKKELDYKYGSAGQEMYQEGEEEDDTPAIDRMYNSDAWVKAQQDAQEGSVEDTQGGDLDIGHQDDEPNMLKKDLYDVITYAAKLYKQLDKYDQHDGEVDFPHWWQKKVTLAREYMSAAQHYLEGEEKQPAIDQLALEGKEADDYMAAKDAAIKKALAKKDVKEASKEVDMSKFSSGQKIIWSSPDGPKEDEIEAVKGIYLKLKSGGTIPYQSVIKEKKLSKEASKEEEEKFHNKLDTLVHNTFGKRKEEMDEDRFLAASMDDLEQVVRNIAHTGGMSEDDAIELAIRKLEAMLDGRDDIEEGIGKTKKALDLVITKMKELAKQYKAGDKSVVGQLKDLTAKKKSLEAMLDSDVSGKNRGQELAEGRGDMDTIVGVIEDRANESGFDVQDEAIEVIEAIADHYELGEVQFEYQNEAQLNEQATCCGRCGRVHVKGTKCKTPYLKGKDHCRNN